MSSRGSGSAAVGGAGGSDRVSRDLCAAVPASGRALSSRCSALCSAGQPLSPLRMLLAVAALRVGRTRRPRAPRGLPAAARACRSQGRECPAGCAAGPLLWPRTHVGRCRRAG